MNTPHDRQVPYETLVTMSDKQIYMLLKKEYTHTHTHESPVCALSVYPYYA